MINTQQNSEPFNSLFLSVKSSMLDIGKEIEIIWSLSVLNTNNKKSSFQIRDFESILVKKPKWRNVKFLGGNVTLGKFIFRRTKSIIQVSEFEKSSKSCTSLYLWNSPEINDFFIRKIQNIKHHVTVKL